MPHSIFLPMVIGTSEDISEVMCGNLTFKPVINETDLSKLINAVPPEYKGKSLGDRIKSGGYINYATLQEKQISLYPLFFEDGSFLKVSRKYKTMGDTAIIIFDPKRFLARFDNELSIKYVNMYRSMLATAQYTGRNIEPYNFNALSRNKCYGWQHEIVLSVRMNPNVGIDNVEFDKCLNSMQIDVGNLQDIAVTCSLDNLIKGRFPEVLNTPEYLQYLESFKMPEKDIKGWVINFVGNVMDVVPTSEWIGKLESIFPRDRWKAVSTVEKLFADGDSMPRLAFFGGIGGRDKVFIHISRIECHFYEYGAEQKKILNELVHFLEKECDTRFCHMSLETNADLGRIKDKRILSIEQFREERLCRKGDLFESHILDADYLLFSSPYAIDFTRKSWHYTVRLFTPDNEHIMWYDAESVMNFFNEAETSNTKRIKYLMKGNVYGKYQKIR